MGRALKICDGLHSRNTIKPAFEWGQPKQAKRWKNRLHCWEYEPDEACTKSSVDIDSKRRWGQGDQTARRCPRRHSSCTGLAKGGYMFVWASSEFMSSETSARSRVNEVGSQGGGSLWCLIWAKSGFPSLILDAYQSLQIPHRQIQSGDRVFMGVGYGPGLSSINSWQRHLSVLSWSRAHHEVQKTVWRAWFRHGVASIMDGHVTDGLPQISG